MRLLGFEISRAGQDAPRVEPPVSTEGVTASSSGSNSGLMAVGWGGLGGQSRVKSLPRVTPDRAALHGTVFACCNNIAGDLSKVPLKLYQADSSGNDTRVREHPLDYLVRREASSGVPAQLVRFAAIYAYALRGVGHIYAPRDGGGELMRLDIVRQHTVARSQHRGTQVYDFVDGTGERRRVTHRSMAHLRYMAEDGWTGRSPLQVAAESVGIALAGQEAAARNASGGTKRGAIKLSDNYESTEDRDRQARRLKALMRDNDDAWPVIGPDEDVKRLDLSAADQELLSSRKFDREMLAAIYRMPPSKLQMLEFGVKANGEQQAIDYLTDCLLHWSVLVEAQLDMALLTEDERRRGLFLRHDFGALLQPTIKEQYEAIKGAVGGPFLRPNEGRQKLGLAAVDEGNLLNPAPNMTRDDSAKKKDKDE